MADSLGSYLAGLFDISGTIFIPKQLKSQKQNKMAIAPKFRIIFHIVDLALAKTIQDALNLGTIKRLSKDKDGFVEYQVRSFEGLWKIAQILNGKLRTYKIYLLKNLINILNQRFNTREPIILKCLDLSCLSTNAWLAGFFENSGHFVVRLVHEIEKHRLTKWSMFKFNAISCFFYLWMPQPKKDLEKALLLFVFEKIEKFLFGEILSVKKKGLFYFECSTFNVKQEINMKGNLKLFFYFEKFPLLSWKYHVMVAWLEVIRSFYKSGKFDGGVLLSSMEKIKEVLLKKKLVKTVPEKFTIPVDEYYFVKNPPHLRHFRFDHLHWRSCNYYNNNIIDWEHLEKYFYKFELEFNGKFDKKIVVEKPLVFPVEKKRILTEKEEYLEYIGDSDEFWDYYWSFKEKKEKGLVSSEYTLEDEVLGSSGIEFVEEEEEEVIEKTKKKKSKKVETLSINKKPIKLKNVDKFNFKDQSSFVEKDSVSSDDFSDIEAIEDSARYQDFSDDEDFGRYRDFSDDEEVFISAETTDEEDI